jgi:DRG Family Regulatory Proteins, Tma46
MPPKKSEPQESKKNVQKKKLSAIDDKTFGLKNKNKSKKVQSYVQAVEKNVMNSGDPRLRKQEEDRRRAKVAQKEQKKAAKAEQDALFGEALLAVQKKSASTSNTAGKIEAKGRDGDDDGGGNKKTTSRAMKLMYQMDAKEMDERLREDPNYVPTMEDEIELQRSGLRDEYAKLGKTGTPVTPESFALWQEKKRHRRAVEMKKRVEAELKKKKGGKGLSVLSGRDLYEYKRELFNKDGDDDDEDIMEQEEEQQIEQIAAAVKEADLFLEGDDEDLDDLLDDDD